MQECVSLFGSVELVNESVLAPFMSLHPAEYDLVPNVSEWNQITSEKTE